MDINNLLVGGFSVVLVTGITVQVVKECGMPGRYLPLLSILIAGIYLTLGVVAPETVCQVVGGSVVIGGGTTMGVRIIKGQFSPGESLPKPTSLEVPEAVKEETDATVPARSSDNPE